MGAKALRIRHRDALKGRFRLQSGAITVPIWWRDDALEEWQLAGIGFGIRPPASSRALHGQQRRLIHRDIKPANILVEASSGQAFLTDFGLAIREEDYAKHPAMAGTPPYMSPEQARGEGHRLDARSDLFSLGTVMFEALTGRRPFLGSTVDEVLHHVISTEPAAPRSLSPEIPGELERICLKLLSKKASDRYNSAAAVAEDLAAWLAPGPTSSLESADERPVVPKGLRSFDARDANFFLSLLPGSRNRVGLPESIAFWKERIEETDPEQTFSVGLIYGPSGCGKSSLVKAGLLPRLSGIEAIFVEATPHEMEIRLQFIAEVASGLAQDGRVISVRLSLFAEMIKSKPWVPQTLRDIGGTTGIGVNFLEETFAARSANPMHRRHASAAERVLRGLLPDVGSDIKGHMRSAEALREISGYQEREGDFRNLLRILDGELRLITPTDPEGRGADDSTRDSTLDARYYQLTHDYLVPSLREWLTRKSRRSSGNSKVTHNGPNRCSSTRWLEPPRTRRRSCTYRWLGSRPMTDNLTSWLNNFCVPSRVGFQ